MDISLAATGSAIAFCGALAGCSALRAFSLRKNLLDRPNERSLHSVPVPRLGGVAIASATWIGLLSLRALQGSRPGTFEAGWLISSIAITALGLVDDLHALRAGTRLLLQFGCAALFCALVGIPPGISFVAHSVLALPPALSLALWSFFIVAVLNIFNFMDGMDGLAGTQAFGAALGIGGAFVLFQQPSLAALCLMIAAAAAGFLFHNFPPAKIFMGDSGSTFLGFSFAALAVAGANLESAVPAPVFALALAPFLLDGTFTLLRRAFRGEPIWKAHRTHLYQRAVRAGRTHHDVLVIYALAIAAGTASSICAVLAGRQQMLALASCAGLTLVALYIWVNRLEAAAASQISLSSYNASTSSRTEVAKST
jgi:UDP-N-acetylmuramyl pentapeptide phosphotransferase/UDP-N-acetylglucosamine-1-phosphate transferase